MNAEVDNGRTDNCCDEVEAVRPSKLAFASGETIALTQEVIVQLDSLLRAWRRLTIPQRELGDEIETFLSESPGSSTIDIARGIRARDRDVRRILISDPRFRRSLPAPGRSRKVKTWILGSPAGGVVPGDGTGSGAATRRTLS
jgi:hypothetical protein